MYFVTNNVPKFCAKPKTVQSSCVLRQLTLLWEKFSKQCDDIESRITSTRFTKEYICFVQIGELLKRPQIYADVFSYSCMGAPACFYSTDPFLGKSSMLYQELAVLFCEYIVGYLQGFTSLPIKTSMKNSNGNDKHKIAGVSQG